MKTTNRIASIAAISLVAACGHMPGTGGAAWSTLADGSNLGDWNRVGNANWRLTENAVVADKGVGFLVSKGKHADFEIKAEFYAEADTNSGIFVRCQDPGKIAAATCYEVNIWDTRPKQEYGTGAIVDHFKVEPMPRAGGRWNTLHITMKGPKLTVVLNGVKTVDGTDTKHASGYIALQHAAGVKDDTSPIKWRKVEMRPL